MTVRRALTRYRLLTALLLLCALVGRVAVPTGYMVGASAKGGMPVIEMCTDNGPVTMTLDTDGKSDGHRDHKAADHPCAFAVASTAVDLAAMLHPVAVIAAATSQPLALFGFARPGLGLAAPPPPKTGPPILR